eukprot:GSMAST32.ASY1.ANO1.663.1 assembled CDS
MVYSKPFSLARRKLVDSVMSGFLIGNTFARSLLTKEEVQSLCNATPIKLLWIGVGDIRNPLTTLINIPSEARVELHFNDLNSIALARNVVLITLASEGELSIQYATAIWSDVLLNEETFSQLFKTLCQLIEQIPSWIRTDKKTLSAMKQHWIAWRTILSLKSVQTNTKKLLQVRFHFNFEFFFFDFFFRTKFCT